MNIEITTLYEEGCKSIRHYSLALRNIRTITIAQGFAVLTAVFYLTKENQYLFSVVVTMFGIALTGILYRLHANYHSYLRTAINYILDIEKKHLDKYCGPWSAMEENRRGYISVILVKFTLNMAIYVLLVITFIYAIIFNLQKIS